MENLKTRTLFFTIFSLFFALFSFVFSAKTEDPSAKIANYTKWRKLTPEAVLMPSQVAALCAAPNPNQLENPHKDKFFNVYVNSIGEKTMLGQTPAKFPVGTVIVKEKLPSKNSNTPELLTVMIKRETGYNGEHGDWQYLVFDSTTTNTASGKLDNCIKCHDSQKNQDFVYKNYFQK